MAKSARATSVKKNRQNLKKKVFGPVEAARNERLSAKLLELASKAKPPRPEMEVEQDDSTNPSEEAAENKTTEDVDMDAETTASKAESRSNRSYQRQKAAKVAKVEGRRQRKPKNSITFKAHPMKAKKGKKR